jgi:hypothetical protein
LSIERKGFSINNHQSSIINPEGWVVTTHVGLSAFGRNVLQVAASPPRIREALACVLQNVTIEYDKIVLRHIHIVNPGQEMRSSLRRKLLNEVNTFPILGKIHGRFAQVPPTVAR